MISDAPTGGADLEVVALLREAIRRAAVADALLVPAPPDVLLDRIIHTATRAIPAQAGTLFLIDPDRRLLTFEVVIGPSAATVKRLTLPLGHGIAGLVAVSGQPLAIANAQQDPRHAKDIAEKAGYLPTTILAVPVTTVDGTVVGVLELLDRIGAATFSLDDMQLLGWFTQLAALALEQRRAHAARALVIGQALVALSGLPTEPRSGLEERVTAFAAQVAADPATQQALALADLVAVIANRGEPEQQACTAVLRAFADYLHSHPGPGGELGALG
jgi:GAF domain-containing protein